MTKLASPEKEVESSRKNVTDVPTAKTIHKRPEKVVEQPVKISKSKSQKQPKLASRKEMSSQSGQEKTALTEATMLNAELVDRFRELGMITRMLEAEKTAHEQTRAELNRAANAEAAIRTDLEKAQQSYLASQKAAEEASQSEVQARSELDQVNRTADELYKALEAARLAEHCSRSELEAVVASYADAHQTLATARTALFGGIGLLVHLTIDALSLHISRSDAEVAVGDMLIISKIFEKEWYLAVNPDVAASGLDPLEHYVRFGCREGRNTLCALGGEPTGGVQ